MPDILVLNGTAHGISSRRCSEYLREHVTDRTVGLARSQEDRERLLPTAEIAVGGGLSVDELDRADRLELFACSSAGIGHLDLEAFQAHDIAVTNASGVHGPNIAEHVLGWLLMINRRLDEGLRRQQAGEWRHFQSFGELKGARVAIVGLGAIGQAILDRLAGFDVETVGIRYTPQKGGRTDEVYGFDELSEALVDVEYLILSCPLSSETEGLIGAKELDLLAPDGVVVNIGRGPVLDTEALVAALRGNKLHAAALDVTDPEPLPEEHPLWNLGNAYLTPHCSGHTPRYWERVGDILLENLEQIDETGQVDQLRNQVA